MRQLPAWMRLLQLTRMQTRSGPYGFGAAAHSTGRAEQDRAGSLLANLAGESIRLCRPTVHPPVARTPARIALG
jgi:hypothetical protein